MNQNLADLLPSSQGEGSIRIWLKSSEYTRRLLLGETGDPWEGAAQYLAYFSQAHGLLRPDVAIVEVGELFDSWLGRNPNFQTELGSKRRLSFPLRKWLTDASEPREILAEVLEAVAAHLRNQVPLVLAIPSPKYWLYLANIAAGRSGFDLDPDGTEDAAMYIADLMRSVSTLPVSGLLLEEMPSNLDKWEMDIDRYQPLVNVAKHYRWSLALRSDSQSIADAPLLDEFDALISAMPIAPSFSKAQGIDISNSLWGSEAPLLTPGQFYFLQIPAAQQPEVVLETIARLRK